MHPSLRSLAHRPWALPSSSWVMAQNWHDLLFAHWAIAPELIRKLVPAKLELDTFQGRAWIGVVPFTMSGVRLRGTPALPWLSTFPELNVRTYVKAGGRPGVWFFSLDAANTLAVKLARAWFHLPYFHAEMRAEVENGEVRYRSKRKGGGHAEFVGAYAAKGASFQASPGTIEHFLTERYCLYAQRPDGELLRGEIHHPPWQLRLAAAQIETNRLTAHLDVDLSSAPALLHFAKLQEVVVWQPERA